MLKRTEIYSLLLTLVFTSQVVFADPTPKKEHLKAALIFNFINFTEWPESAFVDETMAYTICFVGDEPYPEKYNIISSRSIRGRAVLLKQLEKEISTEVLQQCQILFAGFSNTQDNLALLKKADFLPILTISDLDDPKDQKAQKAMIAFIENEQKIGFSINRVNAKQSGIDFSSKMLRLAINVIDDKQTDDENSANSSLQREDNR